MIDIIFTGVLAVLLYVPRFQAQGLSPTDTELLLLPRALRWMAMLPGSRGCFTPASARLARVALRAAVIPSEHRDHRIGTF